MKRSILKGATTRIVALMTILSISVVGFATTASSTPLTGATLTGTGTVGQTLTSGATGLSGDTVTYAWYDCTASVTANVVTGSIPGTCNLISLATGSTYVLASSDTSYNVTVLITDTTASPNLLFYANSIAVTDTISAVSISGAGTVGATLTSSLTGVGHPAYAWYDCTAPVVAGSGAIPGTCGTAITGATSSTYVLASGDYGKYVTVKVTGVSDGGPYYAASIGVGIQLAPTITDSSFPTINSSSLTAGTTLNASAPSSSFTLNGAAVTYQWYDCTTAVAAGALTLPATGSTCTAISGATSSSYVLTGSDATYYVMYSETATGTVGAPLVQFSATTTGPVTASAPTNSVAPALSGQTSYGVSTSSGTWSGVPNTLTYTYSWYRCAASQTAGTTLPSGCTVIPGATTSSYSFVTADLNKYIIAGVSASNGVFAAPLVQYTASSAQVTGGLPVLISAPTITATNGVGSGNTVSVTNGTWAGFPLPSSYSYVWYSCTGSSTASTAAQSSSAATLPTSLGVGQGVCTSLSTSQSVTLTTQTYVVAEVIATNSNGSYYAYTAGAAVTQAVIPSRSAAITISPSGGVYTAINTGWSGQPTPTLSYQWYRCTTSSGEAHVTTVLSALNANCIAISGATSQTYSVVAADVTAANLLVAETATNSAGSLTAYSATSSIAAVIASLTGAAPSITGTASAGSTLTVAKGEWTAVPAPTYTYQWYDCTSQVSTGSSLPAGCTLISGATGSTYVPSIAEVVASNYVMVSVTATNSAGTTVKFSGATAQLTYAVPVAASPPTVPATATTSSAITATAGNWLGAPAPTLSYQWYYCTSVVPSASSTIPTGCSVISGATSASYLPSGSYAGNYFLVAVTGANGITIGGATTNVTVYSASTTSPLVSTLAITNLTISGTASAGSTLTSSATVTGLASYSASYQWYYCIYSVSAGTSVPFGCYAISGATGSSYSPTSAVLGYYITVLEQVTGSNATAAAVANSTAAVTSNIPGAPTNVVATASIGTVTVTWNAPTTGAAVTSYSVSSLPAGFTCSASTTTCTISGLTAGVYYIFTVIATNGYGSSSASGASNSVSPTATAPGVPGSVTAVATSGGATVSWTASTPNGSPISIYTVTSLPAGGSCTTSGLSCVITSLTNGTAYSFSVVATNTIGSSVRSLASNSVTPTPPVPNAPTGVSLTVGNAKLTASWTAATTTGGAVTGYVATFANTLGNGSVATTCTTTTALTCSVSGLVNGTQYAVTVQAKNASGVSLPSAAVSATPVTVPGVPKITKITAASGGFALMITAPISTGGSVITKYQYSLNGGLTWVNLPLTNAVTGLKHRLTYTVNVRAVNAIGLGAKSAPARVVTK